MRIAMGILAMAALAVVFRATAAVPGYQEDFPPGSTGGFGGGTHTENPGTGGVGGADDGYLQIDAVFPSNFGCADFGGAFNGNYPLDGVGGISFWVNDVGEPEAFEMHMGIGEPAAALQPNHWQYNFGVVPAHGEWRKVYINLANLNPAHWTLTHGAGTLQDAIASNTRLNFRHDLPPFGRTPDLTTGDVGIDRIRLHPVCPGETNGDDRIDFADLNNVLSNFGVSGTINTPGDVNNDGSVNFGDLNIVLSAFGADCSPTVPAH